MFYILVYYILVSIITTILICFSIILFIFFRNQFQNRFFKKILKQLKNEELVILKESGILLCEEQNKQFIISPYKREFELHNLKNNYLFIPIS